MERPSGELKVHQSSTELTDRRRASDANRGREDKRDPVSAFCCFHAAYIFALQIAKVYSLWLMAVPSEGVSGLVGPLVLVATTPAAVGLAVP